MPTSSTEKKSPVPPAHMPTPAGSPLSMRDLATILVKHYALHEGRYNLLLEFQIGAGDVGPDQASQTPGIMVGISKVGLVPAPPVDGPTTVNAAIVNPLKKRGTRKR